jgi:hypothetical protein
MNVLHKMPVFLVYVLQFLLEETVGSLPAVPMDELTKLIQEGPTRDAHCIACGNYTTGDKCEECIAGNFRGSEDRRAPCRPYVSIFMSCMITSVKFIHLEAFNIHFTASNTGTT